MVNESKTALLEGLARARADGQPWHAIAGQIRDWSEGLVYSDRRRREIWEPAAEQTGISVVMLKRYYAVLRQIEEIAARHERDMTDLLPASFTGAELAARLHSRDPRKGLDALIGLRARSKTIEDVRDELENAPAEENLRRARHGQAVERCEVAVAEAATGIFGEGSVSGRRPNVRYFHLVGFEIRNAASRLLAGGDLYLGGTTGTSDPIATIGLSVLLSRYLPKFWVMLGPDLEAQVAARADEVLSVLAPRVGILVIDADGGVAVRRPAAPNEEGAARTKEYRALVETFGGRGLDKWKPPA